MLLRAVASKLEIGMLATAHGAFRTPHEVAAGVYSRHTIALTTNNSYDELFLSHGDVLLVLSIEDDDPRLDDDFLRIDVLTAAGIRGQLFFCELDNV